MERGKIFAGRYHVLGGALSALDGVTPDRLNVAQLLERVSNNGSGQSVDEVILAMNPQVEGEATALYIQRLLRPLGVPVTRMAHG